MGGPFRKILILRTIRVVQLVVVPLMKFLRELSSELPGDSVVEYRPPPDCSVSPRERAQPNVLFTSRHIQQLKCVLLKE